MKNWKETILGEIIDINTLSIGNSFKFDEILYLDTGSITKGKMEGLQKFKLCDAPSRAKRLVQDQDIVYSTVRPNQEHYGFIRNPIDNLVVSTGFSVISAKKKFLVPKYLYYFFTQRNITNQMQQIADHTTSTYPSIKPEHIENIKINLPSIPEQKEIAGVLSSLDDKIEVLRKENETLEKIAQTIFKEWFVPTCHDNHGVGRNFNFPNEKGKPYKDAGGKMIDSEMGLIPEDWKVGRLSDECDISIGRTPPRKESQWFSNIPTGKKWISIRDMVNSGAYIFNSSEYLTDEAITKFNIPVIPENTVILSFKMTVGKLAITTESMLSNEAIAHLKLKEKSFLVPEFIYLYLQNLDFNNLGSTSSIVTAINSTMIKNLEIIIPGRDILGKFNVIISPIFKKIKNNSKQIQTLSKTRDALLPKLMSGEIKIK